MKSIYSDNQQSIEYDINKSSWSIYNIARRPVQVSVFFFPFLYERIDVEYELMMLKTPAFFSFHSIRLKDLLQLRLTECGWSDEVRMLCRDVIKEDGGNVNVDKIVQQVTPRARVLVPDTVKKELLQKIKTILSTQEGADI